MPYIGTSPSNGVRRVHTYTATASQTIFTGASSEGVTLSYADTNYIDVFQNGVLLGSADYTSTSGMSVVLSQGASADDLLVVIVYDIFSVADTVSKTNGGSFDSAVTMSNNLTVSGAFTSQGIDDNADATAITIDSSENVGIRTSSPSNTLEIKSATNGDGIRLSNEVGSYYHLVRSNGDGLLFDADAGSGGGSGADIRFQVKGSEKARLNSAGNLLVGTHLTSSSGIFSATNGSGTIGGYLGYDTTSPLATTNSGLCAIFNRHTSDGVLIELKQDNTIEGLISVSGTNVTYGGGHLGRWSRLLDNTKDATIVKGTVMTNLNEMVEWSYEEVLWTDADELPDGVSVGDVKKDAYTEDNEQLNKMAVSSVEGDVNVAGVFVNWDNDDDFNDMLVAMTGDMVIRIAKGTAVTRGDLLMSAGDGTAKPQGDDIVRSKTIAKVTSTNVSHTYDDGTYLVPCVLMAC